MTLIEAEAAVDRWIVSLFALAVIGPGIRVTAAAEILVPPSTVIGFLRNGVTAHRGNSSEFPENTLPAFQSGIELGVDWLELDIFRTKDGQLVVCHDRTTGRVGDQSLSIPESTYQELQAVDAATDFRRRTGRTLEDCPVARLPLLADVLKLVMQQQRTRVSLQPKMDCVVDAVALVQRMQAQRWVGFNEGSLPFMSEVKRLAPEIPVFWDRGADTNVAEDLKTAKQHGFEALVLHHRGVTPEKVTQIRAAGLEVGAWTVNDHAEMVRLLEMGVQRLYTDAPRVLLELQSERQFQDVVCGGHYRHHLQGICVDEQHIYWSFTTALVKTDRAGKPLLQIPVANHHGDLCHRSGRLYVAVNLGKFNQPAGQADSWIYVYDSQTLQEVARHAVPDVVHGAGGIAFRKDHFFVVGGLPEGVTENYVYKYDAGFQLLKRHVLPSGHTHLGIQTVAFAENRWWFGCYGSPPVLLVTDDEFQWQGRYDYDCSLGIAGLPDGRLLSASGRCTQGMGCSGAARIVVVSPAAVER